MSINPHLCAYNYKQPPLDIGGVNGKVVGLIRSDISDFEDLEDPQLMDALEQLNSDEARAVIDFIRSNRGADLLQVEWW